MKRRSLLRESLLTPLSVQSLSPITSNLTTLPSPTTTTIPTPTTTTTTTPSPSSTKSPLSSPRNHFPISSTTTSQSSTSSNYSVTFFQFYSEQILYNMTQVLYDTFESSYYASFIPLKFLLVSSLSRKRSSVSRREQQDRSFILLIDISLIFCILQHEYLVYDYVRCTLVMCFVLFNSLVMLFANELLTNFREIRIVYSLPILTNEVNSTNTNNKTINKNPNPENGHVAQKR